jgi:adenylate kinase
MELKKLKESVVSRFIANCQLNGFQHVDANQLIDLLKEKLVLLDREEDKQQLTTAVFESAQEELNLVCDAYSRFIAPGGFYLASPSEFISEIMAFFGFVSADIKTKKLAS